MSAEQKCEHEGCTSEAIACQLDDDFFDDKVSEWLCPEHAHEAGYCMVCGRFWGGIESFDFLHPGYCDNCWDEIQADGADGDEECGDDFDLEDVF